jgi:acetaldehyde dehydrogenase/alcohol dehydrogenase
VTNPTSTALFKILIALKTRNPLIISPHPRAVRCTTEAARICYEAALAEDAPDYCIQTVENFSKEQMQELMAHKDLALVLATGGEALVKAAYSSGTPAFGVGAGNVPVLIDVSADIKFAVSQIFASKTFDNGTVCASEQAIVIEKAIEGRVKMEMQEQKAYFLSPEQVKKLEETAFDRKKGVMNINVIGKAVAEIAKMANLDIPAETRLLVAPLSGIGPDYPLSSEILAPIIAYYVAADFDEAANMCIDLNYHGGTGHTASIFANDENKIKLFAGLMNAGRVVVNMPSSQGGVGGIFNRLNPSFTLGCGTGGKNITTDNITAKHLLNIQRVTRRRLNDRFLNFNPALYLDETLDAKAIEEIYWRNA